MGRLDVVPLESVQNGLTVTPGGIEENRTGSCERVSELSDFLVSCQKRLKGVFGCLFVMCNVGFIAEQKKLPQ
jgi:hypothetical protein